jgi:hypothetical protein
MATYPISLAGSRIHSTDAMDLSHLHSMPQLISALHHNLRAITSPFTYEQLQKNENVLFRLLLCSEFMLGCL